jgi:hypothetical protein
MSINSIGLIDTNIIDILLATIRTSVILHPEAVVTLVSHYNRIAANIQTTLGTIDIGVERLAVDAVVGV